MPLNDTFFLNPAHLEIARERYFLKEDGVPIEHDIEEVFIREVNYIFQNDKGYIDEALKYRKEKKIMPAGRPLAQSGTATLNLANCFTLSFHDDSREAISDLKKIHLNIQAQGGGVGIDFSTLRPKGSICKKAIARSSGAIGFLTDISYQAYNIQQNGNRSGANLGLLQDNHPDLYEFISYKSLHNWENIRKFASVNNEDAFAYFQWENPYQWQCFNVSVMISDKFMKQVLSDSTEPWKLDWQGTEWYLYDFMNMIGPKTGQEYDKLITVTAPNLEIAHHKASSQIPFFNAKRLQLIKGPYTLTASEWLDKISINTWEDGCPGIVFIDTIRKYHNGEYFNKIRGLNACSEIPLPDGGCCILQSLILPGFFINGKFDFDDFKKAIYIAVRCLDNIIDITKCGEEYIDQNILQDRRVGLGTTGIAELLLLEGLKYNSDEGRKYVAQILEFLRDEAYRASISLAKERGPFPAFEYEPYSKSLFFNTLPKSIIEDIKEFGIRNVCLLAQAPVGTTGTILGYAQGCEPYYYMYFMRNSRVGSFIDGSPTFKQFLNENNINYADYNYNLQKLRETIKVPDYFIEAHEISPLDHLQMQAVFAKYVDNSVAKTVNVPHNTTAEEIRNIFIEAYKLNIKGIAIYRDGSKQQILERIQKEKKGKNKPVKIIEAAAPDRVKELQCDIHHTTVKGEIWTVLVGLLDDKPYEIFCAPQTSFEISPKYKKATIVKAASGKYDLDTGDFKLKNITTLLETDEHRVITRLLSTSLRYGIPIDFINDQLLKTDGTVADFSKAILRVLKKYQKDNLYLNGKIKCPNCGSINTVIVGGCPQCIDCSWSKCE